ncbi:unnamed protein product [Adineta ricciae]|uniref:Uncharacterized protein n=1 Tax=Adineta ricciae TaxID=249248 RepID=A0A815RXP5_ADIRI|nr:unnamed protein product [Adineta ricciae]CAF1626700.1 unnamed protein product [Adineta ricciae]
MRWALVVVAAYGLFVALIVRFMPSDRMQIDIPVNHKYSDQARKIMKNERFQSIHSKSTASLEIVQNENLNTYIQLLLEEHKNSGKEIYNFIARIPHTQAGQKIFTIAPTGWQSSYSLVLIAHKKYDDYHKILLSSVSREATISIWSKIFSPLKLLFGMTVSDHQQIEEILAGSYNNQNKAMLHQMMTYIMTDHIQAHFDNDVQINFVVNKNLLM